MFNDYLVGQQLTANNEVLEQTMQSRLMIKRRNGLRWEAFEKWRYSEQQPTLLFEEDGIQNCPSSINILFRNLSFHQRNIRANIIYTKSV